MNRLQGICIMFLNIVETKIKFLPMRKFTLFVLILLFASTFTSAQVTTGDVMMSMGTKPGYSAVLEGADFKKAEKVWKEYMKPYGKFDKDRKRKEFRAADLTIASITSSMSFSVTLKLEEQRDQTTAHVFFQHGDSYIDPESDPELSEKLESFVSHYMYEVQRVVMREMLEDEEKNMNNLKKDLSKLEKRNEDLHEDIAKYEKKIKEAEEDIEQNIRDQDEKSFEINTQQKLLEKMTKKLNSIGNN